jgi:hypothetical protein
MATRKPADAPAVDEGRVTDGLTNQLFGKQLDPDKPAPTVDYDALKNGAIVTHQGYSVIEYKKDGQDRKTKLHMFATKGGIGGWFSVFGTANLDSQLRKARAGSIMLIRYAGKQKPDATSEQEQHMWEVRETAATPEQIVQLRERSEWRDRELALDAAIAAAAQAERERRESRQSGQGDGAPPHDDSDVPF